MCVLTGTEPHIFVCVLTGTEPHIFVCVLTEPHIFVCVLTGTEPHISVCVLTGTEPQFFMIFLWQQSIHSITNPGYYWTGNYRLIAQLFVLAIQNKRFNNIVLISYIRKF